MADLNPGYNSAAQDAILVNQGAKVYYKSENIRADTINRDHENVENVTQVAQLGKERNENERALSNGSTPPPR